MKNKLVVWGATAQDERVLIALELLPESNRVKLYTFPESVATDEFVQKMMDEWRNDKPLEFPEGYTESERELMVTENLLPEDLKVERSDIIQRAQTEWHFVVLSSKLNEAYHSELDDLKTRVDKIEAFDGDLWGSLKNFWDKVQAQVSDKNLLREHADKLRDATNALFGRLKELRSKLDEDFQRRSKENVDKFNAMLESVETKIIEGLRLQGLFDELKELQRKFRDTEFTRDHRSKVWERLDGAFKQLKDKRSGGSGGSTYGGGGGGQQGGGDENSPAERLKRRYEGLLGAVEKMDRSIQRDRDELNFQSRKVEHSDGQLEMQIRQAKIKMIEERIRSKEEKLNEMAATKTDLESRIESQKERDSRREERHKLDDAKKAAQEKIAHDIEEAAAARQKDQPKLEKAAEALKSKKEESLLGAISTTLGEALEDMVDTARAVAEVLEDRLEDAVEDAKDKIADFSEALQEAVAEAMAPAEEAEPAQPEDGADVNAVTVETTEEATDPVAETVEEITTTEAADPDVETVEEVATEAVQPVEAVATTQQPVEVDDDGPDTEAIASAGPDAVGEEEKTEV
ncbi:MAG: hypothetical protein SH848_06615 [Saprospiraceae bacterium]|nr:hypothetical protein [Saprospiraceae bacterium]MDZ4703581.1 hypothetical protein [Saprospiraceae bacterium]